MIPIQSFFDFLKEARFNPITVFHALVYSRTVTYLRIVDKLQGLDIKWFNRYMEETYHSKVVCLDDAKKIITVNKNVELRDLDQVLPFKHAKDLILKNPHHILAYDCPCRAQRKNPCKPVDVCLVIGDPFVDLIRSSHPFQTRRISVDEALKILKEEDDRGHLDTAWFKTAMLNRCSCICNCCSCCCNGMKDVFTYNMRKVLPSGYSASINSECIGCGKCESYCQFGAIEIRDIEIEGEEKKSARIIHEKCYGCGICETKCKQQAINFSLDPEKGIPLDIEALAEQ